MPLSQDCRTELLRATNVSLKFRVSKFSQQTFREIVASPSKLLTGKKDILTIEPIKGVSLSLREGDRIGLIGRNGSGKTTLCRCLSGIYKPQSGHVQRNGNVVPIFRSLGLPEEELTGRENAALLSLLLSRSQKTAKLNAEEAIEFAELGEFSDMPVRFYSDGMKARLILSVITSYKADVLILDEAISSADRAFSGKLSERIDKIFLNAGAVLLVSHNEEDIRKYCHSAIVYDNGSIAFEGAVEDAIAYYHKNIS